MNYKAKLRVNKITVDMNDFVEDFLAHTVVGMASSLRGVDKIQNLEMHQEKGKVTIKVNGEETPLTLFPNDVIYTTLTALISTLKDIDKNIDTWDITVTA